jgi:Caudovirus prohead serine protease
MEFLEAKATTTPVTDAGEFKAVVATYHRTARATRSSPMRSLARSPSGARSAAACLFTGTTTATRSSATSILRKCGRQTTGSRSAVTSTWDDELGRKVWRQLKANRLGFSFGYVTTRSKKRADGGLDLLELDLYEVSATPSPMNNRTRVLSTKGASDDEAILAKSKEAAQKAAQPIRIATFEC